MLNSRFDPTDAEPRLYKAWEDAGCFKPSMDTAAEPYCIVIPPPNVTGVLHMGHALNHTLQDVLIRFERMRGKNVLWQPGTDHAGIATQMVVERQLAEAGSNESRASLGREEFTKRVWAWKEESGGAIVGQDKRLGISADWSRERFTMDEGLSEAVKKVFVQLYNEKLIYRDKRLVNWDPHFQTAISDLEVENKEVDGAMWHFKYPLEGGETYTYVEKDEGGNVVFEEERDWISIATTRPETMLGDGAVAVHPDDERYAPIVGKMVRLPLADRLIPIIADEYPDPEFGSGAVKITGAHDFNDNQVAKRHGLPMLRLMDERGCMSDVDGAVPEKYVGMDRFAARKAVVDDIIALGLMVMDTDPETGEETPRIEDKKIMQPFGDRSGVVIEPMLTDQWFVNAEELAKPARAAVADGLTDFIPANWAKTYFNWLDNIEPWCISRQLWWGHRIPAWSGPDPERIEEFTDNPFTGRKYFVASSFEELAQLAKDFYGQNCEIEIADEGLSSFTRVPATGEWKKVRLVQEPDVLDTWFSSALWPFSTLGWPEKTEELDMFYPGAVLVTAFDIIFFWVARMMMMGLKFTGEIPFKHVYIHALVLDAKGQKMSKSKGNAMDPLDLIDQYGADALRFTMARMAGMGRNIRLSEQAVEGNRNFGTKLWNAARFCQMNECANWDGEVEPAELKHPVNQWIVSEVAAAFTEATAALEAYRFDDAAGAAYKFVWNTFCDWYLELIKPLLNSQDDEAKAETRRVAGWTLDQILKLLHPFMPFITEELWEALSEHGPKRDGFLMLQDWPDFGPGYTAPEASEEMDWAIGLITEIRSTRSDLGVPAGAKVPMALVDADKTLRVRLSRHGEVIARLARLETARAEAETPEGAISTVFGDTAVALKIADLIDVAEAKARLDKEIKGLEKDITGLDKKLGNANFIERAPAEVVEENRERLADSKLRVEKLSAARTALEQL
ncbi:MAG: valine--tRNA ligase [Hyphomonadaceae bacterium]|nr:valine--tRNA ligase [Hyphomonadaceae bacterium]